MTFKAEYEVHYIYEVLYELWYYFMIHYHNYVSHISATICDTILIHTPTNILTDNTNYIKLYDLMSHNRHMLCVIYILKQIYESVNN